LREISQHHVEPKSDEQGIECRRADDEVEDEALQRVADAEHHHHRDRQCGEGIDMRADEEEIYAIAAQHDKRAMRQIDNVEDAPDESHAEPHQPIEAAQQHAVQ
jgi:hypothetical protein